MFYIKETAANIEIIPSQKKRVKGFEEKNAENKKMRNKKGEKIMHEKANQDV